MSTAEKDTSIQRYDQTVTKDYLADQPSEPVKKRGWPRQGKVRNMQRRLSELLHEVLALMDDFAVPYDNNRVKRDHRMIKMKQKMFGVFRSVKGADMFSRIHRQIATAQKKSLSAFSAISDAQNGRPFIADV